MGNISGVVVVAMAVAMMARGGVAPDASKYGWWQVTLQKQPLWQLPAPDSKLVLLLASGVTSALARYPGLNVVVAINGQNMLAGIALSTEPTRVFLPDGLHSLSLELVNRTTDSANFVVYQHLVAFSSSTSQLCVTPE